MKATGIVRRIDDLGRVVVPKEIRRTLRIREGDPLEIFTDREGEIILKKYSPIGELSDEEGEEYNTYVVTGSFVDRLLASVNIHDADSLRYFHKVLNNKGVLQQIRDMGVQDGDMVRLNDFEFEYIL